MGDVDYRDILSKIQAQGELSAPTTEAERMVIEDAMCCTVLIAEENISEQRNMWQNSALAHDMLRYASLLPDDEESRMLIGRCVERMGDCIVEHPRLSIALMEQLIRVGIDTDELRERLATYKHNVACADSGRMDDIRYGDSYSLKCDPVEWTERWEEVIDDVNREVEELLEGSHRGMGFCHLAWQTRCKILKKYGVEWRSPAVMNPRVMFD